MNDTTRGTFYTPARLQAFLDRSKAKSDEQARAGNLPRRVRTNAYETIWAVSSRTEGGQYWLVTESKQGELACDCYASGRCWHVYHVSRALAGEIGRLEHTPRPAINVSAAFLSGKA
jgi:hypothetical protein